jgi:hypothetical protein
MNTRIVYATEGFQHRRNVGQPGKCEREHYFASLDAAKSAPFPEGCTFAFIPVDNGCHVYHSAIFGWEFHKTD